MERKKVCILILTIVLLASSLLASGLHRLWRDRPYEMFILQGPPDAIIDPEYFNKESRDMYVLPPDKKNLSITPPVPTGSINTAWVRRYNGPGSQMDKATAIAIDNSGNLYVTGSSESDYLTVKYNSISGDPEWIAKYSGPWPTDPDVPMAMVLDASGDIYVTGRSWDVGTKDDYATIKYNSLGQEQWAVRYNGPGNGKDVAVAIAVDASGNVYVTGYSEGGPGTGLDYVTIKYNSLGQEQWVSRYNGGNGQDVAVGIAVDASGNVYVTGYSEGLGTGPDYLTIKYNSLGQEQWVVRYNGPGNGSDEAVAIAVDNSGNVYVTGRSWDVGTEDDYATIKYNSLGQEQWVKRYAGRPISGDFAVAISVDRFGNVYITGESEGSGTSYKDCATVKYNSLGQEQWVRRYHHSGGDGGNAIVTDTLGNIYVAGHSWGGITTTKEDYLTIKYNSLGQEQWVKRYNGLGNGEDVAVGIAVDASGNVYVTGYSEGLGTGLDYVTIKYNSLGQEQWVSRYNGESNGEDVAVGIAVDASGNVYVTGYSEDLGTGKDYVTIKYNSLGVQQWIRRYGGNGEDVAVGIAVDASGNVYVTGYSEDLGTGKDYATIKYDSSGVEQWVIRYNGAGNSDDIPVGIAVDKFGNVYVTGHSNAWGTDRDYVTIKYNSSGEEEWSRRYDGPAHYWDQPLSITVDNDGNVYVAGIVADSITFLDCMTIKYNSSGEEEWNRKYDGPGHYIDGALAIAVDNAGNVYITGVSWGNDFDYLTIKYSRDGNIAGIWRQLKSIPLGPTGKSRVKAGGVLTSDTISKIYAFKGGNTQEFYVYDIAGDSWISQCTIPQGINKKRVKSGASLCYDGINKLYALKGGNTQEFWAYDIENNSWTRLKDVPLGGNNKKIKGGSGLVFATKGDSSFVFCLKGSNTGEFYAYYVHGDTWLKRKDAPLGTSGKGFDKGSCIAHNGGDTIYALKNKYNEFYAYSITTDSWITKPQMPMNSIYGSNKKVKNGASMVYHPCGIIYAFKGGNTQEFWAYNVGTNEWTVKETIPKGPTGKKKVGAGGALCYATGYIFALKGNNTLEFWQYTPVVELNDKDIGGTMAQPTAFAYAYMLYQNSPNPFKFHTAITYSIPTETKVSLMIYDASGRLVKTLVNEFKRAGIYTVIWDGTDEQERKVGQGLYFYVLKTADNTITIQRKMLFLK
ncbi:MAG: SBBP repeat-containing protein [candidate division WOR-3 bacterium]